MKIRLLVACISLFISGRFLIAGPEQSVVQIINYTQRPNWIEPWRFSNVSGGLGSGFVIKGQRVMTNAHVVSWSKQIILHRYQDPKPYSARVEFIGHDCDLAVLKVNDPQFFKGIKPLPIGGLPSVRSTVLTYGYPAGGRQISYTRGVISRIEAQRYAHIANRSFLAVQTDAAINPGNSGGPAIQDGKVVGVSFQGNPSLENAGFFIPPEIIKHFLKDIEDGHYDGFPDTGIALVPLINPAFRKALKLPDNGIGARIDSIYEPHPETHARLEENDVLLAVAGHSVGSDCMIQFQGNRVHCGILFDQVQNGESVAIKIWRAGESHDLELPVYVNQADHISGNQYTAPPYLIIGGLVFTELSRNYLTSLGRNWREHTSAENFYQLLYRSKQIPSLASAKPIVLSKILKHSSNIDFNVSARSIITELNGLTIRSMQDLKDALDTNSDNYHRFRFLTGNKEEALERSAAALANRELLEQYNIPASYRIRGVQ